MSSAPAQVPKWSQENPPSAPLQVCAYPECETTDKLIGMSACEDVSLLCPRHYMAIHRENHGESCASCSMHPKRGHSSLTRHCPDAKLINQLLSEADSGHHTITSNDYICTGCYNTQLGMIKSYRELHSDRAELVRVIERCSHKLEEDQVDAVTRATLKSVLFVANEVLQERAVLLPSVCRRFLEIYSDEVEVREGLMEVGESMVKFSSRWLLSQLLKHLSAHIDYKCVHRKFGTVLYLKGGNLLKSLSWALGRSVQQTDDDEFEYDHLISPEHHKKQVLRDAGDIVNSMITQEIAKQWTEPLPDDIKNFTFESAVAAVDPDLWLFLERATRTVRERKSPSQKEKNSHVKMMRRYYGLCILMYSANSQRPTAFHVLMTDLVTTCGGSRILIKVLNQLGATVSTDTHDRFVTSVAETERERGVWDALPQHTFTVASVDNFDMLQSNAAVYCGDQHRSYHATTIQLVQPSPSVRILQPAVTETNPASTSILTSDQPNPPATVSAQHSPSVPPFGPPSIPVAPSSTPLAIAQSSPPIAVASSASLPPPAVVQTSAPVAVAFSASLPPPPAVVQSSPPVAIASSASLPPPPAVVQSSPPVAIASSAILPPPPAVVQSSPPVTIASSASLPPLTLAEFSADSPSIAVAHIPNPPTIADAQASLSNVAAQTNSSVAQPYQPASLPVDSAQTNLATTPLAATVQSNSSATLPTSSQHNSSSTSIVADVQLESSADSVSDNVVVAARSARKRGAPSSPDSSPHRLGKRGPKKPRTVKVRSLSTSFDSVVTNETSVQSGSEHTMTLQQFTEQPGEKKERESLESKVFSYMLSRNSLSTPLQDFKTMYSETTSTESEPSNIYYMELLDEPADSDSTMRHVADILLNTATSSHQDGYTVLVGDGKTYEHLMSIKNLYPTQLRKLLIFPGDWHTLKNFQPVLMKIFYQAGLKELAVAAGFRGETLTSLTKCSNFDRTHNFLLQAWQALYRKMLAAFCSNKRGEAPFQDLHVILPPNTEAKKLFEITTELMSATRSEFKGRVSSKIHLLFFVLKMIP